MPYDFKVRAKILEIFHFKWPEMKIKGQNFLWL